MGTKMLAAKALPPSDPPSRRSTPKAPVLLSKVSAGGLEIDENNPALLCGYNLREVVNTSFNVDLTDTLGACTGAWEGKIVGSKIITLSPSIRRRCKLLVDFGQDRIIGLFPNEICVKNPSPLDLVREKLEIPGGFVKGEIIYSRVTQSSRSRSVTKGAEGVIIRQGWDWKSLEVHFIEGGRAIKLRDVDPKTVSREPVFKTGDIVYSLVDYPKKEPRLCTAGINATEGEVLGPSTTAGKQETHLKVKFEIPVHKFQGSGIRDVLPTEISYTRPTEHTSVLGGYKVGEKVIYVGKKLLNKCGNRLAPACVGTVIGRCVAEKEKERMIQVRFILLNGCVAWSVLPENIVHASLASR